jgi:UDP-glucose 4-epimerase
VILITGGLGFIGLHTARSLLDLGERCVLTQYRVARAPEFIRDEIGERVFIESLDVTDAVALRAIGERHPISGIVHLATPALRALEPAEDFRVNMTGLINVLEAGRAWGVRRLSLASSVAVYAQLRDGPFREDMALPVGGTNPVETYKKVFETIGSHYGQRTGLEVVSLRISGIYGPLYHTLSNLPSRLVHAAVKGTQPERLSEVFAEDGSDLCYVRDCGRGIALLQTAERLAHRVYNVGAGHRTTGADLVAAIEKVLPGANLRLAAGAGPQPRPDNYCDITRAREEVGYAPRFTVETAVADYIDWLRRNPE